MLDHFVQNILIDIKDRIANFTQPNISRLVWDQTDSEMTLIHVLQSRLTAQLNKANLS